MVSILEFMLIVLENNRSNLLSNTFYLKVLKTKFNGFDNISLKRLNM
jgi:hypothetical protein